MKRRQLELLENVLDKLKGTNHPLSLHIPTAYVNTVISLLNRYDIRSAHFHWFRGTKAEAINLTKAGNFISWPWKNLFLFGYCKKNRKSNWIKGSRKCKWEKSNFNYHSMS